MISHHYDCTPADGPTDTATAPPRVTVVTINYNMATELEVTIQSVINQKYPSIEYILVDGGSTDGSVDIISKYGASIDRWTSEPDKSLYDGMNKGVRAAAGDWLIFMNSGDRFYDASAIADVFNADMTSADIIYGHTLYHYPREGVSRIRRAEAPNVLPLRMNCSHQSIFARRSLLLARPFSIDLLAADYEFLLTAMLENRRFKAVDRVISVTAAGGKSDQHRIKSLSQRYRLLKHRHLMTFPLRLAYAKMVVQAIIGHKVKQLLPPRVAGWALKFK